jgi:phosphatidylglycerol:prolipoprotein diacylglycerol transferase
MCAYYAPLRFLLDFLRERSGVAIGPFTSGGDARYAGLTPAQWACFPMLALGIALLLRARRQGITQPPVPAKFSTTELRSDP